MANEDVPWVVHAAIDAGITLFDTADVYGNLGGSETLLGQALGTRRSEVVVATKFGADMKGERAGLGRPWLTPLRPDRGGVQPAPARHRLDRPLPAAHAGSAHPDRGDLAALDELVQEGKVRYLGSSNLAGWQVVDADWIARTSGYSGFVSAQNEYSWLNRGIEAELVPALAHTGQSLLPYFPLARGAHRQVPPRRGGMAGRRGRPDRPAPGQADHRIEAIESSPPSAASPCSSWPSVGWRPCRRSGR